MKKRIFVCLAVFCVPAALSGCGCDDEKDVDLVFVNGSGGFSFGREV